MQAFIISMVSVVVGGGLAAVSVVGLVNSQTAPPDRSPANVSQPTLEYGQTN